MRESASGEGPASPEPLGRVHTFSSGFFEFPAEPHFSTGGGGGWRASKKCTRGEKCVKSAVGNKWSQFLAQSGFWKMWTRIECDAVSGRRPGRGGGEAAVVPRKKWKCRSDNETLIDWSIFSSGK
jgi:hypothetical protein